MTGTIESPPSKTALTTALKNEARRIGFDLVGITPAVTPTGFHTFQQWLRDGRAGKMSYLPNRESAYEHPRHVLESVRSVVMLAVNYHVGPDGPSGPSVAQYASDATTRSCNEAYRSDRSRSAASRSGRADADLLPARVARYAQGSEDYHDVLKRKLRELADFLHAARPGCRTRGVVDTAPLLERDFARLAGLGWFGKNTMLINKRQGSWLFLAALLTDMELEPDAPHETSHCGTCTRCLDACPTDAFPEPYVLDARRCIAYLNIELRGSIPMELRDGVGNWLFGCDVCQDVCPWNRKAPTSSEPAFQPDPDLAPADALALLRLDESAFRERFRHTPLWRPKRAGLLRNAAIVLGNSGRRDAVPALISALDDPEPLVRGAAAWALGKLDGEEARRAIELQTRRETDANVIDELSSALSNCQ
jgi:epoxyqueuosine reductase